MLKLHLATNCCVALRDKPLRRWYEVLQRQPWREATYEANARFCTDGFRRRSHARFWNNDKKHISALKKILIFLHEMYNSFSIKFTQKVIFDNFSTYEVLHGQRRYVAMMSHLVVVGQRLLPHIVAASNFASCSGVNGNISTLSDTIQFIMFNSLKTCW